MKRSVLTTVVGLSLVTALVEAGQETSVSLGERQSKKAWNDKDEWSVRVAAGWELTRIGVEDPGQPDAGALWIDGMPTETLEEALKMPQLAVANWAAHASESKFTTEDGNLVVRALVRETEDGGGRGQIYYLVLNPDEMSVSFRINCWFTAEGADYVAPRCDAMMKTFRSDFFGSLK